MLSTAWFISHFNSENKKVNCKKGITQCFF